MQEQQEEEQQQRQQPQEAQEATHQGRLVGVGRGNKGKPDVVSKGRPAVDDK